MKRLIKALKARKFTFEKCAGRREPKEIGNVSLRNTAGVSTK